MGIVCATAVTNVTLTVTGAGTWTTPAAGKLNAGGVTESCAYNLNETGTITTIVATWSGGSFVDAGYMEFSGIARTFDIAGTHNAGTCTSCTGVSSSDGWTLSTVNNYLLIQGLGCAGTCSAVTQYTGVFANNEGFAYKMNISVAGTTPVWTSTSAQGTGSAMAIFENSAFKTQVGGFLVGP